jgi:hypothetical protein
VSETDFNGQYKKNPVNLIRRCHSDVSKPQQRYRLAPKHGEVVPQLKYLAYQQCLPGSVALDTSTSNVKITFINNNVKSVALTNDISCKAYDGENTERQLRSSPAPQLNPKPKTQNITSKHGTQLGLSEDGNPPDKGKNAYYGRAC